jgi:flagellar biosynthetic protein FliR
MNLSQELMAQGLAGALAFSRTSGFVVTSPFPGPYTGPTQRVGLALMLAWVASACAPAPTAAVGHLGLHLFGHAASELAIGLLLGAAFRFVLAAADVLAQSVSLATALSSPSVFNPTVQSQEAPLALAISLLGVMVAFSVGAHRVAILWLMESFRALPVGAPVAFDASAGVFVDLAAEATLVGVKQALPVVAVALVTQVTLALIARAAPALQIFNVGIGIIVAAGAAVLMASLRDIIAGLAQHFFTLSLRIEQLLGALAS